MRRLGIFEGEDEDSVAIGIASFVQAQYAKDFADAFGVSNKDVVHNIIYYYANNNKKVCNSS